MANSSLGRFWLALPWFIIALGIPLLLWWVFEPTPVEVTYAAPSFLSRPALDRKNAASAFVAEARGGTTLWRYVEYCVTRPFKATSHRSWVGTALVWHAPDLPTTLSRTPGCFAANLATEIPTSSPTRTFQFVQRMEIQLNPLRSAMVEYAPITLTILAPEDCAK